MLPRAPEKPSSDGTESLMAADVASLETPSLLVDLDRLEDNLNRAAEYAKSSGLRLRPHTKTHKSTVVAALQLERGAAGLTVAKVGEASVMAEASAPSLLVAYPVWGDAKWERLARVASKVPVTVALDSAAVANGLSRHALRAGIAFGVLVETDLGMHRCGLPPGPALIELARLVEALPGLRPEGLMFYPGHISLASPDGPGLMDRLRSDLSQVLGAFRASGLCTDVVSGGSTPTLEGLTEIRPGTYAFNDRSQVAMGACTWQQCALSVVATVVSAHSRGWFVIDAGSKTLSSDPQRPNMDGCYGHIVGFPGARLNKMNEEHGMVDLTACKRAAPRVGDRVQIVPNHVCATVNLHDVVHGMRGGTVEASWRVAARGRVQ